MCSDGLKEAISKVYPSTEFQRYIVHMIRNTLQYVSYKDRKELAKDLKQIYQAPTEEIGYNNLIELQEKWKSRYPNWGVTISELHTYFTDRVAIN